MTLPGLAQGPGRERERERVQELAVMVLAQEAAQGPARVLAAFCAPRLLSPDRFPHLHKRQELPRRRVLKVF